MGILTWRTEFPFLVSRFRNSAIQLEILGLPHRGTREAVGAELQTWPLKQTNEENEIITKDPDRHSRYARGVVAVRMQPTGGDNQRAINKSGDDRPIDATGDRTGSHQYRTGGSNGAISQQ